MRRATPKPSFDTWNDGTPLTPTPPPIPTSYSTAVCYNMVVYACMRLHVLVNLRQNPSNKKTRTTGPAIVGVLLIMHMVRGGSGSGSGSASR